MTNITPSRIARTIASAEWPEVQRQIKLAKGVFAFSCAGHGGIVAVIGEADLDGKRVIAAREAGKTAYVGNYYGKMLTSEKYTRETFERMAENGMPVWEVLVGEEDCDWAVVIHASADPDAVLAGAQGKYLSESTGLADVVSSLKSWNPDYFEAATGEKVEAKESYIVAEREFDAEHADDFVAHAAWGNWHPEVPEGFTGVSATRASDGAERYFLVPEYNERREQTRGHYIVGADALTWNRTEV